MKNILVLAHDDPGQEARLQAALDLGRTLGGHLTCIDVTWTPPIVSNGFYDDAYAVAQVVTEERSREAVNRARLSARLETEDVPWNWIDVSGDFAACIEQAATLADVIVVNRELEPASAPDMLRTAADVIVRSERPVVAVPSGCRGFKTDAALIAWDGSRTAAAALQAALPLLQHTTNVTILEIADRGTALPAEEAAQYLSRHDIHADVRRVIQHAGDVGKTLLAETSEVACDYVVMGGFSRRRWLETLFGGVTQTMLKHAPVPVFYAH